MKGYAALLLAMAVLLLLLPLPALPGSRQPDASPGTESQSSSPLPEESSPPAAAEGQFRILAGEQVISLSEREFLIRTLAFEMSPAYHTEALKAQAVAAYTYYGRQRQRRQTTPEPSLKGADFATPDEKFPVQYDETALREKWGGQYDAYYKKLCAAVDAVLGQHMTYQGAWIDACFFALSCGSTESAAVVWGKEVPYLQPVASPGDRLSPDYETTVTLGADEVKSALTAAVSGCVLGNDPAAWLSDPVLSAAGTVETLTVGGQTVRGTRIREALKLRSASFTYIYKDGSFQFTVHGYGHGVGMSQYGADYLARQGYTWEEILKYYYTGITIEGN